MKVSHRIIRRALHLIEVEGYFTPAACYWISKEQAREGRLVNPDHLTEMIEALFKRRLERSSCSARG